MEIMTYAAACTTRLRLGTTVFVSTLHIPVIWPCNCTRLMCKQLA